MGLLKFGYFDDENCEYVITTPKTPYPWINYLDPRISLGLFLTLQAVTAFIEMLV